MNISSPLTPHFFTLSVSMYKTDILARKQYRKLFDSMVNKRCLSDKESSENPEFQIQRKQQRNELSKSISSWCCTFKLDELIQRNPALLENILRPGVQAAAESAIQHHYLSISRNEAEPSNSRKLTLKFEGLLPKKLHTWTDIESEGSSSPLKIVLVDAVSGVVVTDDPLSSARVEIVVLHGDFRIENWTQKQFDDSIVCQRVDKGPLLVGEHVVVLDNGSATVKQIRFSDNSSWVKPKMFRLGAKIVSEQDRVREAVTPPFKVLHRRGEAYQKNSVPTLQHEVWHLEGVLKDKKIHKRLNDNKIYKVEDLVQEYQKDPSSLCKILNSPKCWKILAKQITKFLLGNNHTNQSNTVPVCNVAFSAAANQVQPVVEMGCSSCGIGTGQMTHILDNTSTDANGPTMEELMENCDIRSDFSLEYMMESLGGFPATSEFFTVTDQSGLETYSNLHGASTSQMAKPKSNFWSKIRAAWKTRKLCQLIRGSNKGKFPCIG